MILGKLQLGTSDKLISFREKITECNIPDNLKALASQKRSEMIECLANVDDEMAEHFLNETNPSEVVLTVKPIFWTLFIIFRPL